MLILATVGSAIFFVGVAIQIKTKDEALKNVVGFFMFCGLTVIASIIYIYISKIFKSNKNE